MDGGTTPDVVAEAIYDAAARESVPLRIPVGDDAVVWTTARERITSDEWVALHTEPDEDAWVAQAERMFGIDTLNPPSLNARRKKSGSG
jgi:hypothetical protein